MICLHCAAPTDGGLKFCRGSRCRNAYHSNTRKFFAATTTIVTEPGALKAFMEWFEDWQRNHAEAACMRQGEAE